MDTDAAVNEISSFRDFEALVYDYGSSDCDKSVLKGLSRRQAECVDAAWDAIGAMVRRSERLRSTGAVGISLQGLSDGIRKYFDRFSCPEYSAESLPEEALKGLQYVRGELSRNYPDLKPVLRQNGFIRAADNAFVFNFDIRDRNSGTVPGSLRFRYRFKPEDGRFSFTDGDGMSLLRNSGSLDSLAGYFKKYGISCRFSQGSSVQAEKKSLAEDYGTPVFSDVKMNTRYGMDYLLKKVYGGKFPGVCVGDGGNGGVFCVSFSGKDGSVRSVNSVYVLHSQSGWELRRRTAYVDSLFEKKYSVSIER